MRGCPARTARRCCSLHGSGGDDNDLLPLREYLAAGAPTLSVRGTVLPNGMPRLFRRLRASLFDENDLPVRRRVQAAELDSTGSPARRHSSIPSVNRTAGCPWAASRRTAS